MQKKQIYVIAVVAIVAVAAVGVFWFVTNDNSEGEGIKDAAGNEVKIPKNVESITAASPSIADIVCYMGYGEKIVAVSSSCTHPDIPAGTPTVGSYSNPDTDAISTANATVTFIDGSNAKAVTAYNTLRDSGMLVVLMYGATNTVNGIYSNLEIIGAIMGHDSYEDEVSALKDEVSTLASATAGSPNVNILISTGLGTLAIDASGDFTNLDAWTGSGVYLAGADSALNSMASAVSKKGTPVSGSGWSQADSDFISTSTGSVDLLIVLWTNKAAMPNDSAVSKLITKMKAMDSWGNCGAVKAGNIVFLGGDAGSDLSRVTPYTVYNGLPILSLYINPGAYSKTAGGTALSITDLPHYVDNTNMDTLVGYTDNRPAALT